MPKPRNQLPAPFASRPFTVTEAIQGGMSPNVLAHSRFAKPFRNVRLPEEIQKMVSLEESFLRVLREGEAFSHTTALRLLGCPIYCEDAIHVTVPEHRRARRAAGVIGHSTRRQFGMIVIENGLQVVPPALALAQSVGMLPLQEIIVAINHLLKNSGRGSNNGEQLCPDELRQLTQKAQTVRARKLRKAARYSRVGAESRMETLLWLLLEAYGLAIFFEAQVAISDSVGWIGRFDLVCERFKLIVEYDGEQHREDREQYLKDERRLDRVRAAGYLVIRLRAVDVVGSGRHAAVRRIADALQHTDPLAVLDFELLEVARLPRAA